MQMILPSREDNFFIGVCVWGGAGIAGMEWTEAGDAANHPTMDRTALPHPQQRIIQPEMSKMLRLRNCLVKVIRRNYNTLRTQLDSKYVQGSREAQEKHQSLKG